MCWKSLFYQTGTDSITLPNGSKLNCLLYADDFVLVSHSAKGLQKALSILAKYCNDWMLSINPKKTKVVIFQKKCRKSTLDKYYFQINDDKIDIVNNYTYLGINFSANGNFRDYKTNLKDKTTPEKIHFCYPSLLSLFRIIPRCH